jgi:hypothetical protein
VRQLIVSPAGPQAPSLFALWDYGWTTDTCYLFGAQGGLLYQSANGGRTWARPRGGLGNGCNRISALAVAPDYVANQTLFASLVGNGIFRSTDGGQLWQPASAGLTSMLCDEILLSPGFESDQTVFATCKSILQPGDCYRSTDSGATWQRLTVDLRTIAMSPEFDQDGVLMGLSDGQVLVSRDRGETWAAVGSEGAGAPFQQLSLAPLFGQWQVVFAFGGSRGTLYRSADGGRTWDLVLSLEESASGLLPAQIAYGPETEAGRLIFLLATYTNLNADPPITQGTLFRSEDGGVSWEALEPPAGLVTTALALSPTYAQDGLLWLGTADGRVVSAQAADLREAP